MDKERSEDDPRGLIFEAYRIEGIGPAECRSIYLDWALGMPEGWDMAASTARLHARYAAERPDHPMTAVLAEGLERAARKPRRRGRR
ncbi:MAG: hypothetical protein D6754_07490 [Alphaproteobacteria bacterium]|nr:MAG: hypothetical protein D6754_07490 [Alphaproteobacteria bacterium]